MVTSPATIGSSAYKFPFTQTKKIQTIQAEANSAKTGCLKY